VINKVKDLTAAEKAKTGLDKYVKLLELTMAFGERKFGK
jgi:hypothetical protein